MWVSDLQLDGDQRTEPNHSGTHPTGHALPGLRLAGPGAVVADLPLESGGHGVLSRGGVVQTLRSGADSKDQELIRG